MSKVILTDVDEVIFNWQKSFEKWILREGRYQPTEPLGNYWNVEQWLNISDDEGTELIQEFNHMEEFWPDFEPLPRVQENVEILHKEGFKFVAITACATDDWTHSKRWENLQKCFGQAFDTLHCVGLWQSKRSTLARYRSAYWVDDKFNHALDGALEGHKSYLMSYPWNVDSHDERLIRVSSWDDITKDILG